jgi:hypothetical protein
MLYIIHNNNNNAANNNNKNTALIIRIIKIYAKDLDGELISPDPSSSLQNPTPP